MTTKRIRNANNANGAVEILDDGTVQISDKTDKTKKLLLDASMAPSGGTMKIADSTLVTEAYASKPGLWFQKTSGQTITYPVPSGSFGTGDFCILAIVRYPAGATTSSASPNDYDFIFSAGDAALYNLVAMRASTGQAYWYAGASTNVTGGPAVNDGRVHAIAAVRRAGILELYVDGQLVNSAANTTSFGAFTLAQCFIGYNAGTRNAERTLYRCLLLNYAPTAATVARLSVGGRLDYSDISGNFTNLITNGGFETGVNTDNWINGGGTPTYNDTTTGRTGTYNFKYVASAASQGVYLNSLLTIGKRYSVTIKYQTSDATNSVRVTDNFTTAAYFTLPPTNGVWVTTNVSFVATNTILAFGSSAAMTFYIDDLVVSFAGAIIDYEPEGLTSTLWHDESGNGVDGAIAGAQLFNTPHFANTDYGLAAVMQDVQDNSFKTAKYYVGANDYIEHSQNETALAVGSSDVTAIVTAKIPASKSTQIFMLQNGISYIQFRTSTGQLLFGESNSGTSSAAYLGVYIPSSGGVATYAWVRYSTDKYKGYVNGVSGPEITKTRISPAVSLPWKVSNTSLDGLNGEVSKAIFFNYALSEDKIRRYSSGAKLDYEDIGGSMFKMLNMGYTGDNNLFDSGVSDGLADGWSVGGGNTTTIVTDSSNGWSGERRQQCSVSANFVSLYNSNANMLPGKVYTISFDYINTTGSTINILDGSGTTLFPAIPASVSTKSSYSQTAVWARANGANVSSTLQFFSQSSTTGVFQIRNLQVKQLGALIDLEPENISDSVWIDASPNGFHGTTIIGALAEKTSPTPDVKNYLINGNFEFAQRTSFGTEGLSSGSGSYWLDRWMVTGINAGVGPSSVGVSQQGSVPTLEGSGYNIKLRITDTTTDAVQLFQRIESSNAARLNGKYMTLSFWAALGSTSPVSGLTRGYKISVLSYYPTLGDNYGATTNGPTAVIYPTLSTTYQKFSIPFGPITANSYLGLQVVLEFSTIDRSGENFAQNGWFQVSHMMLTEGVVPPPLFVRAGGSISGELAICQRYYEKSYPISSPPGTSSVGGYASWNGGASTSSQKALSIPFRVNKRINGTHYLYDYVGAGGSGGNRRISTINGSGTVTNGVSSIGSNVYETTVEFNTTTADTGILAHWVVDAEI